MAHGRDLAIRWARPIVTALRHSKVDAIPIAALSVMSLLGTFGAAGLTHHPLVLIFLSARLPFLALIAPRVGLTGFLVVGALRLCAADPFHFRIGRRLGGELHLPQPHSVAGRFLLRFGVVGAVLVWPVGRHLMAAGATDQKVSTIVLADVLGTIAYLLAVYYLGKAFF